MSNVAGTPIDLQLSLTPQVPANFTGRALYGEDGVYGGYDTSAEWLPVMRDFLARTPIRDAVSGCPGTCIATVRGHALAVEDCTTELQFKNYSRPMSKKDEQVWSEYHVESFETLEDTKVFEVFFATRNGSAETLSFTTSITDDAVTTTCAGHLNTTTCNLVSAIAEYEIVITDGLITFAELPSYPTIVTRSKNTAITDETIDSHGLNVVNRGVDWVRTTLSGIAGAAFLSFGVQETIGVWGNDPKSGALLYPSPTPFAFEYFANYLAWDQGTSECAPAWNDPRENIMAALNELAFRTGVYTANTYNDGFLKPMIDDDLEIYYNLTGIQKTPINVFEADFSYFAGAAAVELFTILIILFTFYGFWGFGRSVTLSPLEIAKAFDSPLLLETDCNYNGRDIARFEGQRTVQYGALNAYDKDGRASSGDGPAAVMEKRS